MRDLGVKKEAKFVVGYDCRPTSKSYSEYLVRGINAQGFNVVSIGMVPTSAVYWSIQHVGADGGIQITGSHNPADNNGFKICVGNDPMPAALIQKLKDYCEKFEKEGSISKNELGITENFDALPYYIDEIVEQIKPNIGSKRCRVVVDAGNGVAGLLGVPVLKKIGVDVIELFCEPDGTFPNHHPDPTLPENIEILSAEISKHKADCGIGWDGDGDRIVVLDETGAPFAGDHLLLVLGRALLEKSPGATIIGDVKCSQVFFDDLRARGANVVMSKSGHSSIKARLKELKADLSGELSGHICYGDRFYGFDCAVYDTARFIEILSNLNDVCSTLRVNIPVMYSTKEERFDSTDSLKFKVVDKVREHFSSYNCNLLDGVRVSLPNGWILLRASNTQPVLVSRVEADSKERLAEYSEMLSKALLNVHKELDL